MARQIHLFDPPDRFVAGTVGVPGDRTFYLQATGGGRTVSVALEKAQVALLAEKVRELLEEVRRRGIDVPLGVPRDLEDVAPLESPVEEEFRVAALALGFEVGDVKVIIEAQAQGEHEPVELDDNGEDGPDTLRVRLSPREALAFAARAGRVVDAGRPPCPLCGLPLDPGGHICPRMNGFRH
ncbi:MAG TPA: DUF3090 family protein [Mycobacteriales bacterium]|jgi:uncharacterized repeat protein (TIGR03847 family)|nr:DUF3090 family protein [Mycobacteriales bacterium]